MSSVTSVSYLYRYEGTGSLAGSYRGEVRLIPRPAPPTYRAELRPSPFWDPSSDEDEGPGRPPALVLASGGEHVAARDGALRRFSYGTVSGGSGHLVASAPYAVLFQFAEPDPFAAELRGELALEGQEMVSGELCDVIRATNPDFGGADVWWYIGVEDDLPRALRWVSTAEGAEGEFTFTIETLDIRIPLGPELLLVAQQPGDEAVDEDARRIEPGAPAPDLTLAGPGGGQVALSELRGSVAVLDFGAGWCALCRTLMTEYDRLARAFADQGVRFFGVSTWESPDVDPAAFRRALGIGYPVLRRGERAALDYKVATVPALFVIGRDGELVHVRNPVTGDAATTAAELEAAIREALRAPGD